MKIVVLLCGVADPKWPLRLVGLEAAKTRAANPVVLNPFEESALEIGLKIREGRSGTTLHAFMVGGSESSRWCAKSQPIVSIPSRASTPRQCRFGIRRDG